MIMDLKDMVRKIEGYLEDYNSGTKHGMKLIMFLDACDHVSRICRILRQPQGNALLLGVGGSGRQSLSRLASFISNYKCY
jgi:dynein heavy chain